MLRHVSYPSRHRYRWRAAAHAQSRSKNTGVIPLRKQTVRTNTKEVDEGRPSGHSRRGLGAIRALCRAWRALKVFFSAGVDKTISREFCVRRCFVFRPFKCWCAFLIIRISLKTARHAVTLGFLCRDRVGVHYHPSLARCVPCAVCHACMCRV